MKVSVFLRGVISSWVGLETLTLGAVLPHLLGEIFRTILVNFYRYSLQWKKQSANTRF